MSKRSFIISAPSGAGKTTLCRMLTAAFADMRDSISYTTRVQREGEVDGVDYHFIDDAKFAAMVEAGEFIEHAEVFGRKYGTSGADIENLLGLGLNVLLEIDVQGTTKIRKNLADGVYIFILPPSIEILKERLETRGNDTPEEIEGRLKISATEITHAPEYDYIIINDDLTAAFETLKAVVNAETSGVDGGKLVAGTKKEAMIPRVKKIFGL